MSNGMIKTVQSDARMVATDDWHRMEDAFLVAQSELGNGFYVLAFKHDEVALCGPTGEAATALRQTGLDMVKEARLFSAGGELKLWRYEGGWRARLRLDGQGDNVEMLEEQHLLDKRFAGRSAMIHDAVAGDVKDSAKPPAVAVQSYFSHDAETGLISFYDARLVDIVPAEEKEK
jgi:hypothetical protein